MTERSTLERKRLSDLHQIASQLGIKQYRKYRKPELAEMIYQVATEQAARTAARVAMSEDDPAAVRAAATASLPQRLRGGATTTFPDGHVRKVSIEARVPSVLPASWAPRFTITRTVEMPEVSRWD
jgi:hypothetical protein